MYPYSPTDWCVTTLVAAIMRFRPLVIGVQISVMDALQKPFFVVLMLQLLDSVGKVGTQLC